MKRTDISLACLLLMLLILPSACRNDDIIFIPEQIPVSNPEYSDLDGFYLLNEGNMGSNKASLDYYDFSSGIYSRNIYGNANPDVPKEMGDVGNDLKIYGSRLYAVINCSNKVEVMDAATARRIGQIEIPNCRKIEFHGPYAYVTSYAGPVEIRPDYAQIGFVAKIDTATLKEVDRCLVGYQPDGLAIADGKIYVANSGGYMVPKYENTVSVIDIATFTEIDRIEIALNLHGITVDKRGRMWVSSRGDYYDTEAALYCYDLRKRRLEKSFPICCSSIWVQGDSLYSVGTAWSYVTMVNEKSNNIIDMNRLEIVSGNFITDGTDSEIRVPYGVAVNPISKDIYITDARNYVNPGYLHCYSKEGVRKWSVRTGDVPAHFAFRGKLKSDL